MEDLIFLLIINMLLSMTAYNILLWEMVILIMKKSLKKRSYMTR
jgi:hypothetical protein